MILTAFSGSSGPVGQRAAWLPSTGHDLKLLLTAVAALVQIEHTSTSVNKTDRHRKLSSACKPIRRPAQPVACYTISQSVSEALSGTHTTRVAAR